MGGTGGSRAAPGVSPTGVSRPPRPHARRAPARPPRTGGASDWNATGTSGSRDCTEDEPFAQGDLSYSAWSGGKTNYTAQPVRVGSEGAPAEPPSTGGASAWNAAGTFESRDCTEWAKGEVREKLAGLSVGRPGGGTMSVTEVSTLAGDAQVNYVRGQRRCGFDFEVKLAVAASTGEKGTLLCPSVGPEDCGDPDDLDATAEHAGGLSGDALRAFKRDVLLLRGPLCEAFRALHEALKAR